MSSISPNSRTPAAFVPVAFPSVNNSARRSHARLRPAYVFHQTCTASLPPFPSSSPSHPSPPSSSDSSPRPCSPLADVSAQRAFLRSHWGNKPILFRQLLPNFESPLTPDDLAGLASDPSLPSRIIEVNSPTQGTSFLSQHDRPPYTLRLGPFPHNTWDLLPPTHWTLLVQGVNRRVPALADLLDRFGFVPHWRLDDIQASYAPKGGGVGPHVDNYDVFLIQASGRRRWRVSNTPIPSSEEHIIDGIDVRVLDGAFVPDEDWILEPGDALYVPPRFPHWGESLDDDCMTFSVGFRAPTVSNLLSGWVECLTESRSLSNAFYVDDVDDLVDNCEDPARISPTAIDKAYDLLLDQLRDSTAARDQFARWFASEVSQQKDFYDDDDFEPLDDAEMQDVMHTLFEQSLDDEHDDRIRVRDLLVRQHGSVFTYVEDHENRVCMYIDGEMWPVQHADIAKTLCTTRSLPVNAYRQLASEHPSSVDIVRRLFSAGLLYLDDGSEDDDPEYIDDEDYADARSEHDDDSCDEDDIEKVGLDSEFDNSMYGEFRSTALSRGVQRGERVRKL